MNDIGRQIAYVEPPEARAVRAQTQVFTSLMSGRATFDALARAVQELRRLTPNDCDVWIQVGNILVREATFVEPHTFTFEGFDQNGDRAWVVQHFSQLSATIVHRPKLKADMKPFTSGVIYGFRKDTPSA
jgi:hypothetical protein